MSEAQMNHLEADLLHRVRVDAQLTGRDEPLLTHFCTSKGWLKRDLHGCLFVTSAGLAALASHEGESK